MPISIDPAHRLGRTRLRVSPGVDGGRCLVRSTMSASDSTVPTVRPMVTGYDRTSARVSLVPEGAVLLAGDAIEIDVAVDSGATLELSEPGGTVAYDMRGGSARWDVTIRVAVGAALTWAGEPFVVAEGADVSRSTSLRYARGARIALRETVVLGRAGERPGRLQLASTVRTGTRPVLVEQLPLNRDTVPGLIGEHRVLTTVLSIGAPPDTGLEEDRFQLAAESAVLWRRLSTEAHQAVLPRAWEWARGAAVGGPRAGQPA